jgi:hypothetical protein
VSIIYSRLTPQLSVFCLALVLLAACGSPAKTAQAQPGSESPVAAMLKAHQLEGRVVLVEFGTIGCQLSGVGLDSIAAWQQRGAVPGLAFVRLEPTADQATFDSYYSSKTLGFPVVRDTEMAIANALGTTVYPRFVLLDKFGRVRYRGNQPSLKGLADWTDKLAAEKTDAGPSPAQFGETSLDVPALLAATKLPALDGTEKSLRDYLGKHGLLLVFVDTRCPFSASCSKEMPAVAAALGRYGVTTVLVNIGDPADRVKSFYGTGIAGASVVYDTGKAVQDRWNMQFVPTVVLLDEDGNQAYRGSPVWGHVAEKVAAAQGLPADSVRVDAKGTSGG